METSAAQGIINGEVSKWKHLDPYREIESIHIGYVHPHLEEEYVLSKKEHKPIRLKQDYQGLPVFVNGLRETDSVAKYKDEAIEEQVEKTGEVIIGGFKATKSFLKRNFGLKEKKNV